MNIAPPLPAVIKTKAIVSLAQEKNIGKFVQGKGSVRKSIHELKQPPRADMTSENFEITIGSPLNLIPFSRELGKYSGVYTLISINVHYIYFYDPR